MRGKALSTATSFYSIEFIERRLFLSASAPGSVFLPGVAKPTAAQISAMLKQTVTIPVERPNVGNISTNTGASTPTASAGYTAAQFNKAYGIDQLQNSGGTGAGQTIAIIDAYADNTVSADLATFDTAMGLSAPPNFWVVGENGGAPTSNPPPSGQDVIETALDVEWAHAVAPQANILLVECNSLTNSDLIDNGVNWVEHQTTYPNVCAVSMSFGEDDNASAESAEDQYFNTPVGHTGITFIASTGDDGAYNDGSSLISAWPASAPNVLSIGGTTMVNDASSNVNSEIAWGGGTAPSTYGAGGGVSTIEAQPSYQVGTVPQGYTGRTVPDVSLEADPNTGVAVSDSQDEGSGTSWVDIGGTSLSAPAWAGLIAITDQLRATNGLTALDGATQTLPMLYGLSSSDFHDITQGNNGFYDATPGYDLVTGRGTPIANKLVVDLAGVTATPDLKFATPGGWQSPLVVTPTNGSRTDGNFVSGATLLVDWNAINGGVASTTSTFHSELLVDGVVKTTLTTNAPLANGASFGSTDFSIGSLSAGTHTISVQLNYLSEQSEATSTNDIYSRKITVVASANGDLQPLTPGGWTAPVVVTNVNGGTTDTTIHNTDSIYLDLALANGGSVTSGACLIDIAINGQLYAIITAPAFNAGAGGSLVGLAIGTLPAGTYSLAMLINYNDEAPESNLFNNNYLRTFTVLGTTGTVTGTVYQDTNADGIFNGSDSNLANQTVYLDINGDGKLDSTDIYAITNGSGAFTMSSVPTGSYTLRDLANQYVVTAPAAKSFPITVTSGGTASGSTFAQFPIAFTGTTGNDTYSAQRSGATLQILVSGVVTYTALNSLVPYLAFLPGAGDDAVTINTASGNPIPSGGIYVNTGNNITADTLQLNGSASADSITANAGQLLFGSSPITYQLSPNIVVDPKGGSDTLLVNSGAVSVPAQTPGGGILARTFSNLSINSNASLQFASPATHTDRAVVVVTTLGLSSTGKIDLGTNDMIIHGSAPSLTTGYASGAWNGNGIDSSAAAGDATHKTALGELINNVGGVRLYTTFDGQSSSLNDAIIKYTYYGDANLDGIVNALDFNALATNFGHTSTTWQQGDFNYSGTVNSDDFAKLANNFGATLT